MAVHAQWPVEGCRAHAAPQQLKTLRWHEPCVSSLTEFAVVVHPPEKKMHRRVQLKLITASIALGFGLTGAAIAQSGGTIKVGILHSLSGTMAISETVLKDTVLMAIDEINAKGSVLGKKLEPVIVDPASNWPLFAEKTKQLLGQDKVAVIFGCWTSVSRKSVLAVVEEMNGLLFYLCNTKVKNFPRTCSTPAQPRTSRRSLQWTT